MSQSLKLGTQGNEVELPEESRYFDSVTPEIIKQSERSINGTLNTDYTAYKRTWRIGYDTVKESTKDLLENIVKEQLSGNELFFIYTNEAGSPITVGVDASLEGFGALLPSETYYYYGTGLILVER